MTLCNAKIMKEKYRQTLSTNVSYLRQCYRAPSYEKERAYFEHAQRMREYGVELFRIISYNTFSFSIGCVGIHPDNGRKIFIYITPTKTRYAYIDEL